MEALEKLNSLAKAHFPLLGSNPMKYDRMQKFQAFTTFVVLVKLDDAASFWFQIEGVKRILFQNETFM